MKLTRILPIIVSVSVLLCAFVPFTVSADVISSNNTSIVYDENDLSTMRIPLIEEKFSSSYGGFVRVVSTSGTYKESCVIYFPPIGATVTDTTGAKGIVSKYMLLPDSYEEGCSFALSAIDENGNVLYCAAGMSFYKPLSSFEGHDFGFRTHLSDSWDFVYSDCDIYDSDGVTVVYPPPSPPPSFSDHIANVDMSSALVEVLGVLPACLACLVAYASIRKGIGYVRSIISNA